MTDFKILVTFDVLEVRVLIYPLQFFIRENNFNHKPTTMISEIPFKSSSNNVNILTLFEEKSCVYVCAPMVRYSK